MPVIIRGYVSVYSQGGAYQLYADEMQPDGTGALFFAFEQLKNKLEKDGYFDASRKKPIPRLPKAIGVITSPTGAVIKDITQILNRRYTNSRLIIYGTKVQGSDAASQIVKGIECFNNLKNVDVIILARGGGSLEDLWPFNEEGLALAIFKSKIPIISAVGHETDFSISDFVADLRAPTPSAAAEMVMPEKIALKQELERVEQRLSAALTHKLKIERNRLLRLENSRTLLRPKELINHKRQKLDIVEQLLIQINHSRLERAKSVLSLSTGRLNALSPLTVLSRGYAVVQNESCEIIKSSNGIKKGDNIIVTVADGKFEASFKRKI